MEFIETSVFRKLVEHLLTDDRFFELQLLLTENPNAGEVIPRAGGARKLRWSTRGSGKRGGLRVIYCHLASSHQIYFLLLYPKADKSDLTQAEIKLLAQTVRSIKHESQN